MKTMYTVRCTHKATGESGWLRYPVGKLLVRFDDLANAARLARAIGRRNKGVAYQATLYRTAPAAAIFTF